MKSTHLTTGEAAALTLGAGAAWLATQIGWPAAAAVFAAWSALALVESYVGPVPDAPAELAPGEDHLEVRFVGRPRLGDLAMVLGGLALALGVVSWTLPLLQPVVGGTVALVVAGGLFLGTLLAVFHAPIDRWNERHTTIRIDAATRRLTVRGVTWDAQTHLLGEVAGIRAHHGALRITHTDGELALPLDHVDAQVLANVATELDRFARQYGADPEAPELRRKARAALAGAQRDRA